MPFYVYAIHTDHTNNRLYSGFESRLEAEKLESEMRAGNYPTDNYFVRTVLAHSVEEADMKADALRPFPKKTIG